MPGAKSLVYFNYTVERDWATKRFRERFGRDTATMFGFLPGIGNGSCIFQDLTLSENTSDPTGRIFEQ